MHGKVPERQGDGYQACCPEKPACVLVGDIPRKEGDLHQVHRPVVRGGKQAGVEAEAGACAESRQLRQAVRWQDRVLGVPPHALQVLLRLGGARRTRRLPSHGRHNREIRRTAREAKGYCPRDKIPLLPCAHFQETPTVRFDVQRPNDAEEGDIREVFQVGLPVTRQRSRAQRQDRPRQGSPSPFLEGDIGSLRVRHGVQRGSDGSQVRLVRRSSLAGPWHWALSRWSIADHGRVIHRENNKSEEQ